tara:strand:+ start:280 stop:1038 length:759 start_codon:yes stop_codon:yes gene_type:complete
MRLKLFVFSLMIALFSNSLLSEENKKSKNLNLENNNQKILNDKNLDKVLIHVVKKGETISSISRKYSIKKELIIQVNKLLDENYIFVGQNLKIVKDLFQEKNNFNTDQNFYHEIKKGENLTEIAHKYNLTLAQLVEINGIEDQDVLVVGTKLKLKDEISKKKETPTIAPQNNIELVKIIKEKKYGPLVINSEKIKIKKRKKFLEATHKNGKRLILKINCDKKEINVRGIGRKWKGWMPAREAFEVELLNDFC